MRLLVTILSCLGLAAGAAACGSSASSSSSTSASTSAAAASSTSTSTSASTSTSSSSSSTTPNSSVSAGSGPCQRLLPGSTPAVTAGSTPALASLEKKAYQKAFTGAFGFTTRTCIVVGGRPHLITVNGAASLHPTLVVDAHETVAGQNLEVRFIGSTIYIYLAEIASRDGGKPWLVASLKRLSSVSGLDFAQLLDQIRQLSPNRPSPFLKAATAFRGLGRATIAGQTVYVYRGNFGTSDLGKLGLTPKLAQQTAANLQKLGATSEQTTTYVNSSGVAVRTVTAILKGSDVLSLSISSSSRLGHAITVSPPPASKSIAYSKLAG